MRMPYISVKGWVLLLVVLPITLGTIVSCNSGSDLNMEEIKKCKYDSLRGVAYDSMIKGQANGKTGYYLFMKNTFKGTGIPASLDTQGVNNGHQ